MYQYNTAQYQLLWLFFYTLSTINYYQSLTGAPKTGQTLPMWFTIIAHMFLWTVFCNTDSSHDISTKSTPTIPTSSIVYNERRVMCNVQHAAHTHTTTVHSCNSGDAQLKFLSCKHYFVYMLQHIHTQYHLASSFLLWKKDGTRFILFTGHHTVNFMIFWWCGHFKCLILSFTCIQLSGA